MKFLEPAGLIIILVLVIIVFFPRRLPDVAKPLRRRMTVFRENGKVVRSRGEGARSGDREEPEDASCAPQDDDD